MKLDTSKIDGYAEMSVEEKLKAIEALEIPEPDYTGYVKKDVFDKTASELAEKKKELRNKLSEDEAKQLKEQEERETLQANYEQLLYKTEVTEKKSQLLAMGYDEALATETAKAMQDGNTAQVFANQQKFLTAFEKKVRAESLKNTPAPQGGGKSDTLTLDKFREMSVVERADFAEQHPEEYKSLYGGN